MTTMSWSKSTEDDLDRSSNSRSSFKPVRKAMSGIFRNEKSPRQSSPSLSQSSSAGVMNNQVDVLASPPKRRKRISFGRSFASPLLSPGSLSSGVSSRSSSGDYFGSRSASSSSRSSKRASHMSAKYLFTFGDQIFGSNSSKIIQEDEGFVPPKRPSCPAPVLNLSNEECQMVEYDGNYANLLLSCHYAHLLRRVSQCPSEESFYCRGLHDYEDAVYYGYTSQQSSLLSSIIAPNALKSCVRSNLLSTDFSTPPSSIEGSIYSMETASEMLDCKEEEDLFDTCHSSNKDQLSIVENHDMDMILFCPSSPKPIVRLQLILPPYLQLQQRSLNLQIESNASILELKESLCSTLYRLYDYSVSPASIALFLILHQNELPRRLENDLPLYQEGIQDDDEILVRF